jgi:hypothetical protein
VRPFRRSDEFWSKAALRGPASVRKTERIFERRHLHHLTIPERRDLLRQISSQPMGGRRIFGECTDKHSFGGQVPRTPPFEEAFTQVVTRFHRFLEGLAPAEHGLLVQDNNDTMARRLTELMRLFHERGSPWGHLRLIVETPLFVDSSLTSLVQAADVCAYATRRFCENNETSLFDLTYSRIQRVGARLVGMRHYTNRGSPGGRRCTCRIEEQP